MTLIIKDYGDPSLPTTRDDLEKQVGRVWDTQELTAEFQVHSFLAPFVRVSRKSDGQKGTLEFTHYPRFYFRFKED